MARVLRPGGRLSLLEVAEPRVGPLARRVSRLVPPCRAVHRLTGLGPRRVPLPARVHGLPAGERRDRADAEPIRLLGGQSPSRHGRAQPAVHCDESVMRFQRQRIATQSREVLRTVGARDGWLIETADVIRVGFGAAVDHVVLDHGLDAPDVWSSLSDHELVGVDGPSGSGVVAFGALPFDRSAPSQLDVPEYCLTQKRDGEAWLTSAEGAHGVDRAAGAHELTGARDPEPSLAEPPAHARRVRPQRCPGRRDPSLARRSTRWCSRAPCAALSPKRSTRPRSPSVSTTASHCARSTASPPVTSAASWERRRS